MCRPSVLLATRTFPSLRRLLGDLVSSLFSGHPQKSLGLLGETYGVIGIMIRALVGAPQGRQRADHPWSIKAVCREQLWAATEQALNL